MVRVEPSHFAVVLVATPRPPPHPVSSLVYVQVALLGYYRYEA